MESDKRKKVRPVTQMSIADSVFKKRVVPKRRVKIPNDHPLIVLADLRRGSLTSLDRYLRKNRGIADRKIAIELRKLISGSASRTKFRLLVVEHPNSKNRGGRPRTGNRAPTVAEKEIAERCKSLEQHGATAAVFEIAKATGRSESTVRKARDRVREYENRVAIEADRQIVADQRAYELQTRREAGLRALRAAKDDKD